MIERIIERYSKGQISAADAISQMVLVYTENGMSMDAALDAATNRIAAL